ncbi:MAG: ABC transporter substrate-binding protein [Microbacterium sp.]
MSLATQPGRPRRTKHLARLITAVAAIGVGALVISGCSAPAQEEKPSDEGPRKDLVLNIGTLLPQTGELAHQAPGQEAGVALAAKDINDADLGITVNVTYADSGDPDNKAYSSSTPVLLNSGVSAIVGTASSGVTKLVIDEITGAGVVLISPSNTSPDFTTWDDGGLFWRTAPSDLLQGEVLGNLIAADGHSTLGFIALNDAYGSGLQKVTAETFESAGGKVVGTEYFNVGDTNFAAQIASVMGQKPDAIALISFDQSKTIIPALKSAGFDTSNLYLVDANLLQYGDLFPDGTMTGAQGTSPGRPIGSDFEKRLIDVYAEVNNGAVLTEFPYSDASYDAVILLALAALAANSTDGAALAAKLQEVSGGSGGGTKVTDFAAGAKIILDGGVVDYDGLSGGIKFDEAGDPTETAIGISKFDEKNIFHRESD